MASAFVAAVMATACTLTVIENKSTDRETINVNLDHLRMLCSGASLYSVTKDSDENYLRLQQACMVALAAQKVAMNVGGVDLVLEILKNV